VSNLTLILFGALIIFFLVSNRWAWRACGKSPRKN
jgi:hypothetical protein